MITPSFYPVEGGLERHVYYLSKELIKKGHQVEVFTSDRNRNKKIQLKEEIYEGIKIRRFRTWFNLGDFASFFPGVFKAIKESDADIFHFHNYRHPHLLGLFFTEKPCFLTPHWPNYPKGLRSSLADLFVIVFDLFFGKFFLNRFNKILSITDLETGWFVKKFNLSREKFVVIPNGIPENYLTLRDSKNFRKKYNIKYKDFVVLSLSRIHRSKGLDLIVKVSKYFPKIKFLIGGVDGGYMSELKILKENLGADNVFFIGEIPEDMKLNALRSCDVFLFPSHYEGFGIVVLEAFSQKACVLSSYAGALPWVIDNAGLTFKDNDLKDLKNKLELLIKNKKLRDKYSSLGYERVQSFTWSNIVNMLEVEYGRLVDKKV